MQRRDWEDWTTWQTMFLHVHLQAKGHCKHRQRLVTLKKQKMPECSTLWWCFFCFLWLECLRLCQWWKLWKTWSMLHHQGKVWPCVALRMPESLSMLRLLGMIPERPYLSNDNIDSDTDLEESDVENEIDLPVWMGPKRWRMMAKTLGREEGPHCHWWVETTNVVVLCLKSNEEPCSLANHSVARFPECPFCLACGSSYDMKKEGQIANFHVLMGTWSRERWTQSSPKKKRNNVHTMNAQWADEEL